MDEAAGQRWVKATIKAELDKRGMNYADLCRRLQMIGIEENERNLRNKVARGTFSAVFFMQCLQALGVRDLHIDILPPRLWKPIETEIEASWPSNPDLGAVLSEIRNIVREKGE